MIFKYYLSMTNKCIIQFILSALTGDAQGVIRTWNVRGHVSHGRHNAGTNFTGEFVA